MPNDVEMQIADELQAFEGVSDELCKQGLATRLGPAWALNLSGRQGGAKTVLSLMALVHGNEVAGLRAINEFLQLWTLGPLSQKVEVNVILGNPDAARENKRFLESDLNRSFLRSTVETKEHQRARALEPILAKSDFLLDIHQTRELSEQPFFIFPYSRAGLSFAAAISPSTPVVTHWGKPFSKDGRCTDEFVNAQGGCGITIEVGQNSFSDFSVAAALRACVRAVQVIDGWSVAKAWREEAVGTELYTWAAIHEFPADGEASLLPGFRNFMDVKKGQHLGQVNGRKMVAEQDGKILFPFYLKPTDTRRPTELCRLLRRISGKDLPA